MGAHSNMRGKRSAEANGSANARFRRPPMRPTSTTNVTDPLQSVTLGAPPPRARAAWGRGHGWLPRPRAPAHGHAEQRNAGHCVHAVKLDEAPRGPQS